MSLSYREQNKPIKCIKSYNGNTEAQQNMCSCFKSGEWDLMTPGEV